MTHPTDSFPRPLGVPSAPPASGAARPTEPAGGTTPDYGAYAARRCATCDGAGRVEVLHFTNHGPSYYERGDVLIPEPCEDCPACVLCGSEIEAGDTRDGIDVRRDDSEEPGVLICDTCLCDPRNAASIVKWELTEVGEIEAFLLHLVTRARKGLK